MQSNERDGAGEVTMEAGFDVLPPRLAADIEAALATAVEAGVLYEAGSSPLQIFQAAVAESVRDIEGHAMGQLIGRFLRDGPYEGQGPIPEELAGKRLSDEETALAVGFVYSFMVNTFKGLMAELLGARPVTAIVEELKRRAQMPASARIFAGDLVRVRTLSGDGWAKGADFHVLDVEGPRVRLCGVVEVKSYPLPRRGLTVQLERHVERARQGLSVQGTVFDSSPVAGLDQDGGVLKIEVATDRWRLPRHFRLDEDGLLHQSPIEVPVPSDQVEEVAPGRWRVTLRWSQEALAEAALELTFWYMGKVGELRYVERPLEWEEMTAAEAGQNAVKMMLYYALLRAPEGSLFERQAVALYNAYGFGYALGMNFIGPGRRRRMLWPEDLREIQETRRTQDGGRIRGYEAQREQAAGGAGSEG